MTPFTTLESAAHSMSELDEVTHLFTLDIQLLGTTCVNLMIPRMLISAS